MGHVRFDDTKENKSQKLLMTLFNTSVNESFQLFFKPKVLNAIEIIRDKEKRSDIDIIHDYITKTEASNAGKTLIENLVKEFILLNRKY